MGTIRHNTLAMGFCLLAVVGVCAALSPAEEPLNPQVVRKAVSPKVCLVVAENAAGVPRGYATGFLMGDGRFALTDLATLAQPGVAQAELRFDDGTLAKSVTFGMADPALGVAAIFVEQSETLKRDGLRLSLETQASGDRAAVAGVGWQWSKSIDVILGRLVAGDSATALAVQVGAAPAVQPNGNGQAGPGAGLAFLSGTGEGVPGTSGAPVIGADGEVAGVMLDVARREPGPVVAAAPAIRRALLASNPQLRPFAQLPKPLWPVRLRTYPGEAPHVSNVSRTVAEIRARVGCSRCRGTGTINVRRVIGQKIILGTTPVPVYGLVPEPCPVCHGESVLMKPDLYGLFASTAEQGTRFACQPGQDPQATTAVRRVVAQVLSGVARVGSQFREAFVQEATAAIEDAGAGKNLPAGFVLYVQVREIVDGPDGRYALLVPYASTKVLATRMGGIGGASGVLRPEDFAKWTSGKWLVLAGSIQAPFSLNEQALLYVQPLAWVDGPLLSSVPPPPARLLPDRPVPQPPGKQPSNVDGAPDFFGL
jgi:hypothetical protein